MVCDAVTLSEVFCALWLQDVVGIEPYIPHMNGGYFASHQEAQVGHAMPYTDMTQPISTMRPSDLPDVAYSQSHVDLMTSASEIAVPPVGEEEEDVEEDLLRAQLLMSLAQKRKEKEDAEVGGVMLVLTRPTCQNKISNIVLIM